MQPAETSTEGQPEETEIVPEIEPSTPGEPRPVMMACYVGRTLRGARPFCSYDNGLLGMTFMNMMHHTRVGVKEGERPFIPDDFIVPSKRNVKRADYADRMRLVAKRDDDHVAYCDFMKIADVPGAKEPYDEARAATRWTSKGTLGKSDMLWCANYRVSGDCFESMKPVHGAIIESNDPSYVDDGKDKVKYPRALGHGEFKNSVHRAWEASKECPAAVPVQNARAMRHRRA